MKTHDKWLKEFNEGTSGRSFAEFICGELDKLAQEAFGLDEDARADIDQSMRESMMGRMEGMDLEPVPPTDPNAGDVARGSTNT